MIRIFTIVSITLLTFMTVTRSGAKPLMKSQTDTLKTQTYPEIPTDISPLLIGEKIPVVKLPAADGRLYDLNAAVSQKPTILVFYRGGWCPFCNRELAGIQSIQADLVKMGYQIIAISTDSPSNLSKSAEKNQLTYTLLSDADLAVSKQFGLAFKAPEGYSKTLETGSEGKNTEKLLPVPSVFILDKKGAIQFEYINPDYRQRISTELMTAVAGALIKSITVK
ncbi:peroxiredoxin family protein [Mucilaginibacter litoreus]|uniref:thioredoxin-dependent peroxiredoxin n=1 Tax=Mucilaginibacter litoreus TaxID=1048221 RepID=A0ABW3AMD8_9SPHI